LLYSFLPGSGATYTWREAAAEHGLEPFWMGGSKLPAITQLLEATFERQRGSFCGLMLTAVRQGMKYRVKKGSPVTREEIQKMNGIIVRVGFKIPELHDEKFLGSLPSSSPPAPPESQAKSATPQTAATGVVSSGEIKNLHKRFLALLAEKNVQARGYALEELLNDLYGLAPRGSFRVAGEQIDGSFEWHTHVFLVEARWREAQADTKDLLVLRGKVEGKSEWTRGLFISINGFSSPASDTLRMGRRANLITIDGQDLTFILEERWSLLDAIRVKLRHAGETGEAYLPLAKATSSFSK
jgi:hypothetical protein